MGWRYEGGTECGRRGRRHIGIVRSAARIE